jgi:hypothetical protein
MDELDLLEGELRKKKVRGAVLFDLLLVNGNMDRYYLATFDGELFAPCRMQNVDSRRSEFCRMSAAVYKETAGQVDTALLSPAMRLAIARGIPL